VNEEWNVSVLSSWSGWMERKKLMHLKDAGGIDPFDSTNPRHHCDISKNGKPICFCSPRAKKKRAEATLIIIYRYASLCDKRDLSALHYTALHYTIPHSTPLAIMLRSCIICKAVDSPTLQLEYCDACQSAVYCSRAFRGSIGRSNTRKSASF
jgi:hypothetical protein